jgi:hypothetical protein
VLQGTFDIFSLTELIGMLASGTKTGILEVEAGTARGRLHLREGLCTAVEPGAAPPTDEAELATMLVEVCFELAREPEGSFRFLTEDPPASDHLVAVDEHLDRVGDLLTEWHEVRGLVPSLEHCPALADELDGDSITLSAAEWRLAVSLDGRATVRELVDTRRSTLLDVCREIAGLVERGAVRLHEARVVGELVARSAESAEVGGYEVPKVVPTEPYGPGVDEAAAEVAEAVTEPIDDDEGAAAAAEIAEESEPEVPGAADPAPEVASTDVPVGPNGEPLDGDDVKDRGALLRMFSALRDA